MISDNPQLTVRDWSADDDIDKNLDPRRIVLGSTC